jgi:hypothetical protein
MIRGILAGVLTLFFVKAYSQNIGINATGAAPDPSAILDIASENKGILIPRVSLQSLTDSATIKNPAPWLIVFNINNNIVNGNDAGLYFNGGTETNPVWVKLVAQKIINEGASWLTQGNSGIDTAVNYIGNTDDKPLLFRINGIKSGLIDTEFGRNTFIGYSSGLSNTGTGNTFFGSLAGLSNTTGINNIAMGLQALQANTTGSFNVAIGDSSLSFFNTNSGNVAVGSKSLSRALSSGQFNTAIGYEAMRGALTGGVSGARNTAVGYRAMQVYNTGRSNVAIGTDAMRSNSTGFANVAVGDSALSTNTIGSRNIAIGRYALWQNANGAGNIAIGDYALASNGIRSFSIAVGDSALTIYNGMNPNTAVGARTLRNYNASGPFSGFNTVIGRDGMYRLSTGNSNTGMGDSVGFSMTKALDNVLIGRNAGKGIVSGSRIIAIGNRALERYSYAPLSDIAYSANNIAIGYEAMFSTNASDTLQYNGRSNIGIGNLALRNNSIGNRNTVIGDSIMIANTSGSLNSAHGYRAMEDNLTGSSNSAFGALTSVGANFTNAAAFGYQATATGSNFIAIGNTSVTEIKALVNLSIFSDSRFKTNIDDNVPGLAFIKQLKPVTYNYNLKALHQHLRPFDKETPAFEDGQELIRYSGFMAQEVDALAKSLGYNFSGVVTPRHDGDTYSIRYAEFIVPLVKAVQEQQLLIETQKNQIKEQAEAIKILQEKMELLEKVFSGR